MDREKEAWEELQRSRVSPTARWVLALGFLLLTGAVLVLDLAKPYGPRDAVRAFTERSRSLPPEPVGPWRILASWNEEVLADIDAFEEQIAGESVLRGTVPAYQWLFLRVFHTSGAGRVLVGRDDWFFLKEALETTLGWTAEENRRLADRAVRDLAAVLEARGAELLLVPVPGKAGIQPDRFSRRFARGEILPPGSDRDSLYRGWEKLPGVKVVRVGEILEARTRDGRDSFLYRDTHWTPEAMRAAVDAIVRAIRSGRDGESPVPVETGRVSGTGDLLRMIDLPQDPYPEQEVTVSRPVESHPRESGGRPARVIFLGDSFAAVYSDDALGWGAGAGLQDWLPAAMGEPVRFFLNYGDPILGPRRRLARLLAQDQFPEGEKPVVIWQFAERFLNHGDWAEVPFATGIQR